MTKKYIHTPQYLVKKLGEQAAKTLDQNIVDMLKFGTAVQTANPTRLFLFVHKIKVEIHYLRKAVAEWIYGEYIDEDY